MNASNPPLPVVAGIDGSDTAIGAAQWAVDEAVSRNVPLRLVYVTKAPHPTAEEYDRDIHHAHASLRAAQDAIEAGAQPVKVETALITGPPGPALVEESRDAAMVCVGSVGIGRYARSILGSTATDLAEKAHCPVAIIRPQQDESRQDVNWIVVAVNDGSRQRSGGRAGACGRRSCVTHRCSRSANTWPATATGQPSRPRSARGDSATPACTSTRLRTKPTSHISSNTMTSGSSWP